MLTADMLGFRGPLYEGARRRADRISELINGRSCLSACTPLLLVIAELLPGDDLEYMEIGVLNGGSMCLVCQSSKRVRAVGIDLFEHGVGYKDVSLKMAEENIAAWGPPGSSCLLISGNSHDPDILSRVSDRSIDLLFIDGDHSQAGAATDWDMYSPLVKPGGVVVFDDYNKPAVPAGMEPWPGVRQAVDRLSFAGWDVVLVRYPYYVVQRSEE